jgi:hypothetical protein
LPARPRHRFFGLLAAAGCALALSAPASADSPKLRPADPVGIENAPAPAGAPLPAVPAGEAEATLAAAEAALAGEPGAGDASVALAELGAALPSLSGAERRRGEALLARPTDGANDPYDDGYTAPFSAYATTHFCYFWVSTGSDAVPLVDANTNALPDYIELLAAVSEQVWAIEHGSLAWREPPSDGSLGCDAGDGRPRVDVYTKNVGVQGLYGYAAIDPGQQGNLQHAFLVLDNDQAEFLPQYGSILPPMQVTMAHEYNHVIQYGYDILQDRWMFEATATWMEEMVFPTVNDYLQYLTPWTREITTPMTSFSDRSLKVYGSAVWNHWLSRRLGQPAVRDAWAASLQTRPQHLAVKAYDRAIRAAPGDRDWLSEYVRFAAATAEWRSTSAFPDSAQYPDVRRTGTLATSRPNYARYSLNHTTYRIADVPDRSGAALKLELRGPRGVALGLALVGRIGDGPGARVISVVRELPRGGVGSVRLLRPGRFSRISAVLINADIATRGFSSRQGDWIYPGDNTRILAGTFKVR